MSYDIIQDLIEQCEAEGKLYVIAIFEPDMSGVVVNHSIDSTEEAIHALEAALAP
jgi:hypothetical protein